VIIRLLVLLNLINPAYASIGEVTESKGSGVIERELDKIPADESTGVEMMDEIRTARGEINITFDDDTQVSVSEHSELLIDDFVYDPQTSAGALGLKVALGTVRYASGNIAHSSPDTVDIQTPSASIAVRGTAFAMTVDEIGDSLIVLLPNADGSVGEIVVESDIGQVVLNQMFQATSVKGRDRPPSSPARLLLSMDMINNLMIVSPPKKVIDDEQDEIKDALSIDLLAFDELNVDLLEIDEELTSSDLDIDMLNVDLLANLLNSVFDNDSDGKVAGYNSESQVYTFIEDPTAKVVRVGGSAVMNINFVIETGVKIELFQGDSETYIDTIDGGSGNQIRIIQR
jgi:hypothetical protein